MHSDIGSGNVAFATAVMRGRSNGHANGQALVLPVTSEASFTSTPRVPSLHVGHHVLGKRSAQTFVC